jgi:hypothetical protein
LFVCFSSLFFSLALVLALSPLSECAFCCYVHLQQACFVVFCSWLSAVRAGSHDLPVGRRAGRTGNTLPAAHHTKQDKLANTME